MEDVLSWTPNGLAFTIHDPERLTRTILPLFLGATKYKSFFRQLYHWSFQRDTTSNVESHNDIDNIDSIDNIDNKNSDSNDNHSDNNDNTDRKNSKHSNSSSAMFSHPYFIRGKKSLCEQLTRESFKRSSNPTHGQVSTPVTTTTNTTAMDADPACCSLLMQCKIN
jgi:HSF-type DNA-binding